MVFRTAEAVSGFLSDGFGEKIRLKPDLEQVRGLSAERSELWSEVSVATFLTVEEKRQAVEY